MADNFEWNSAPNGGDADGQGGAPALVAASRTDRTVRARVEPWLSDCRTLSDTVGQMSDTVGVMSDCRMSDTVGRLSDTCRSYVGAVGQVLTVMVCCYCRTLSDTVGLSDCRTCRTLSDCRKTVGHCRTLSEHCWTVGRLSG